MALAQEDIQQIQLLIQKSLAETPAALNANVRFELDLRERTLRMEEQLKHQRELMIEGFKQMDKRFEQMDKRFEQVDKRIEQVEKRIEQAQSEMNNRFEQAQSEMNKRFEQTQSEMNKRFEQAQSEMNKRFDQQHQEVMVVHHEIKLLMRWGFGAMLAIGGLMVSMLRLVH